MNEPCRSSPRTKNYTLDIRLSTRVVRAGMALVFVAAGTMTISSTQDVRLSTYYPAPNGLYQQMLTSNNAYLNPNAGNGSADPLNSAIGNYVEIGPAPGGGPQMVQDSYASLVVPGGNIVIGANSAAGISGLHIGGGVLGGQAQIELDNSNGASGQVNRWTNRLELWANDQVAVGAGPMLPYSSRGDVLNLSGGVMSVAGNMNVAQPMGMNANGPLYLGGSGGNTPHACQIVNGASQCNCTPDSGACVGYLACCISHLGCGSCTPPLCGCQLCGSACVPGANLLGHPGCGCGCVLGVCGCTGGTVTTCVGPSPPANCGYGTLDMYSDAVAGCPASAPLAIGGGGSCVNTYGGDANIASGSWESRPAGLGANAQNNSSGNTANGWRFGCANPTFTGVQYTIYPYAICCQDANP